MAYAGAMVDICGHRVLGTYSTDVQKRYVNDERNRRFYLEPVSDLYFDYGEVFLDYRDRTAQVEEPQDEKTDKVFRWMKDHRQVLIDSGILDESKSRLNVDFVSRRGPLTNLLRAGADKKIICGVAVTLFRGTYYFRSIGKKTYAEEETEDVQMKAASSTLLFQHITSKDGRTPDEPAPMNANASFYSTMTMNCGDHRLLFAGELQAERRVNADEPPPVCPNPRNYLNVRTRKRNQIVYPLIALKWWAPNKLSGIPEIVCGLRDDNRRIIQGLEYIETERLTTLNYTKDKWDNATWEEGSVIRTFESLLSQMKELIQGDDPNTAYHGILELEPVPDGPGIRQRLKNRRFRFRDRREDDDPYLGEEMIREILEGNID